MKAKKNVPQETKQPKAARSRGEDVLGPIDEKTSQSWMVGDFGQLREFYLAPDIDNTHTAASLAFERIQGLCSGQMTVVDYTSFTGQDWRRVMATIDLNACILRHAFELVAQALIASMRKGHQAS
jgi:hypothetical protein